MIIRHNSLDCIEFDGLQIFDYTANKEVSSSLAFIEVPSGAKHRTAWSRRSDKYYYVQEGRIEFTLDTEKYELEAGDFCLVHRGQRFSYQNVQQEPAKLLLVHTPSFDLNSEVFEE